MTEESWHRARLIPTSGINGAEEQERRATSALLAVMGVVSEFSRGLLRGMGAPAGSVQTFIEVPFELHDKRLYPDGLIRVSRGSKTWTALVEVKTGRNELQAEQLDAYIDIARANGFDAVLTISNEIPPVMGQHPTQLDRRKLKRIAVHHRSWSYLLSLAVMQKEHRGVSDSEQAWILGELIRYLEHPKSGALEFEDMGPSWVQVRDAVGARTLRGSDKGALETVTRFDALLRFASLKLGRQLGADVVPALSRNDLTEPEERARRLLAGLVEKGELVGSIRIPGTVGPICVTADLRAGTITCHVDIDAPGTGRSTTRVNWLVRQLKHAPEDARIESFAVRSRGVSAAELLSKVRDDPKTLIPDPERDIKFFRVAVSAPMGSKRGRGRGSFIDTALDVVDSFYGTVLQDLKAWSPSPPRLRAPDVAPEPVGNSSTALSSQDGSEATPADSPGRLASAKDVSSGNNRDDVRHPATPVIIAP